MEDNGKALEKRFRELGFIGSDETVVAIKDYSLDYNWRGDYDGYHGRGGQVYWWLVDVSFPDSRKRTYVMKCPVDTFGSGIRHFVEERAALSKKFIENGISVPLIEKYDDGTMVHEYVEGVKFDAAVKKSPDKEELYWSKRREIISKIKSVGYDLVREEDHDGNYIVTPDDDVVLIDLDVVPTGTCSFMQKAGFS